MSENGSGFGGWLREKLVERRMSLAKLCRAAGCDYTYIWRIVNGDRTGRRPRPSFSVTQRLGSALEAPREALVRAGYTTLGDLDAAVEADRQALLESDTARIRSAEETPQPETWEWRKLPTLGSIQAGDLHEALENPDEYSGLPEWLAAKADFTLQVRGESMRPTLLEGDIVAVRETPTAVDGELIVVMKDDEASVKRFEMQEGTPMAVPDNPRFRSFAICGRTRIAGVVVGSYRPPEVLLRRPR